MRKYLLIDGRREGYGVDQLRRTMTVGELRECLEDFDDDTLVALINDNGYTYGSITEYSFSNAEYDEESKELIREEDEW